MLGLVWSLFLSERPATDPCSPSSPSIPAACTPDGNGITYNEHINVALAVAMPDGGLITPVLKDADKVRPAAAQTLTALGAAQTVDRLLFSQTHTKQSAVDWNTLCVVDLQLLR